MGCGNSCTPASRSIALIVSYSSTVVRAIELSIDGGPASSFLHPLAANEVNSGGIMRQIGGVKLYYGLGGSLSP